MDISGPDCNPQLHLPEPNPYIGNYFCVLCLHLSESFI